MGVRRKGDAPMVMRIKRKVIHLKSERLIIVR
jgi:hypothetical protein